MFPFTFGPLALTNTYTTNLFNPPAASGGVNNPTCTVYALLKHLRIVNKTGTPQSFRIFLGATGANTAGTEIIAYDKLVPANDYIDWYSPGMRINPSQFLVGGASAATSLTIEGEGLMAVSG